MPISCEFIDVVIPIANIDRVHPGGFAAFKEENKEIFGKRFWHDDFLFRDGAMSPYDAQEIVKFWERKGLEAIEERKDDKYAWKGLCVVEHMFGGPTMDCDWIEFDEKRSCVYLKGTPKEPVIGREDFGGES